MGRLSNREVRQVDMAVVVAPDDGLEFAKRLRVSALAFVRRVVALGDPPE